MLSHAMENYLKVIYEILEQEDRATTSLIAGSMGIAAASVTAMVKKLAELRLIRYAPYQGVRLTAAGKKTALEVVRHHRLLEAYLSEALGVPWDRVHDEADQLEHVLSEDLEDRIAAALGEPSVDPHGAPIPSRDGIIQRASTRRLTAVESGETVTVVEVADRDSGLLRFLGGLRLFPGTIVEVLAVDPYQGPLVLRANGREFTLGAAAAEKIRVTSPSSAEEAPQS
jgi:DtxR family Mn-dependent transcriptional regulator